MVGTFLYGKGRLQSTGEGPGGCGSGVWVEHQPANQTVAGLTPSQGIRAQAWGRTRSLVGAHERQPHTDVSFPLSKNKKKYIN